MKQALSVAACALAVACAVEPTSAGRPAPSGNAGQPTSGGSSSGSSGASGQGGAGSGGVGTAGSNVGLSGSAGLAGSAGSGGSSGTGGSSGGSGAAGAGGRTYSTDPTTFFGESRCAGFAVCESFESTAIGDLPAGFSLEGYGDRTVEVSDGLPARGSRALRIDVPSQSAVTAWLTRESLGPLGDAHFGRVFVQISEPAPSQFVHFDLFAGIGPFDGHTNEVRWASTGTGVGTSGSNWSFIYNVQPSGNGAGGEFGSEGDRSAHPSVGDWMCLEWSFDAAEQDAQFFLGGSAVEYLHIDTERSEIPVFESLAVGFAKYQNTGAFVVHIDEAAFDAERIGCNN